VVEISNVQRRGPTGIGQIRLSHPLHQGGSSRRRRRREEASHLPRFGRHVAEADVRTWPKFFFRRAPIALRRQYPDLKIFARASDADHAQRLQETLDVIAMVPIVPEDNVLLTLPFGGAVLKSLGAQPEEVNAILESKRKAVLDKRGLAEAEDEATLMELGISTEEERTEALNKMKEKSPMVAQVIEECVACPPDAEEEQEVEEDEELVLPSDELNDTLVEVGVSAEASSEDD